MSTKYKNQTSKNIMSIVMLTNIVLPTMHLTMLFA